LRWVLTSRSIESRWWHINCIMHGRLTISECHWWSNINFGRISLLKLLTSRMPFSS
jgi:hypothetical protein